MNIPRKGGNVYRQTLPRIPVRTIHPQNAPHVTAFVLYLESDGKSVARSEGTIKRILRTPPAIAVDAGSFAELERAHVDGIEVYIKDTDTTYTTTPEIMRTYGAEARRFGVQLILSLKYWSIDGQQPAALKPVKPQPQQPEATQGALFDFAERGPVYR